MPKSLEVMCRLTRAPVRRLCHCGLFSGFHLAAICWCTQGRFDRKNRLHCSSHNFITLVMDMDPFSLLGHQSSAMFCLCREFVSAGAFLRWGAQHVFSNILQLDAVLTSRWDSPTLLLSSTLSIFKWTFFALAAEGTHQNNKIVQYITRYCKISQYILLLYYR